MKLPLVTMVFLMAAFQTLDACNPPGPTSEEQKCLSLKGALDAYCVNKPANQKLSRCPSWARQYNGNGKCRQMYNTWYDENPLSNDPRIVKCYELRDELNFKCVDKPNNFQFLNFQFPIPNFPPLCPTWAKQHNDDNKCPKDTGFFYDHTLGEKTVVKTARKKRCEDLKVKLRRCAYVPVINMPYQCQSWAKVANAYCGDITGTIYSERKIYSDEEVKCLRGRDLLDAKCFDKHNFHPVLCPTWAKEHNADCPKISGFVYDYLQGENTLVKTMTPERKRCLSLKSKLDGDTCSYKTVNGLLTAPPAECPSWAKEVNADCKIIHKGVTYDESPIG